MTDTTPPLGSFPPPTGSPALTGPSPGSPTWATFAPPARRLRITQALPEATAVRLALAAGALGVLTELLRPHGPVGVGVLCCILVALAAVAALARDANLTLPSGRRWWFAVPVVCGGVGMALRTSPTLTTLNACMVVGGAALMLVRLRAPAELGGATVAQLLVNGVGAVGRGIGCFGRIATAISALGSRLGGSRTGHVREAVLGLVIAVPVLALFAGLFASADAGFEQLLAATFDWDVRPAATFLAWTAHFGVVALVVLCGALVSAPADHVGDPRAQLASATVLWMVLGSLVALFALFLALQASYLFGGAGYLERTSGLTAAEYARHGFFQLVTAAMLVLPLVLTARALARGDEQAGRALRVGGCLLLVLTLPLLASSAHRMWLYQERFGLTELRIYVVATIVWLAIVVVAAFWRLATRSDRGLALVAILAAFVVTAALDVLNPDALIARVNLDRPRADDAYVARLSADALPAVAERANRDGGPAAGDSRQAFEQLRSNLALEETGDWRSWNHSRERAREAARE